MKKYTKSLFSKSLDSLTLAVDHFNRPFDCGRQEAVLILLDRAFELLLKAIILHKGGKIREPYEKETIGFDKCVRKCLSDSKAKCLTNEQGITLQIINSFRDSAQHDILELSEQDLYMYCQTGITLYKDLLGSVFKISLSDCVPSRVLPISTEPPKDLHSMIEADFQDIKKLVKPRTRTQFEARAKLKALAIIESSLSGIKSQPSEFDVNKLVKEVRSGKKWTDIFPGIATLQISTSGTGINVDIRITKSRGDPVTIVPEGTPGGTVLALRRVNETDFYSLGLHDLADKIKLTRPRTLALIRYLKLQESDEYYKEITIGKSRHKRYSHKALDKMKKSLPDVDIDDIWEKCGTAHKK